MKKDDILIQQCKSDKFHLVEALIANGADVNATDEMGNTSLHYCKSKKMAQLLIDSSANMNAMNEKGSTPLSEAMRNQLLEVIDVLTSNGAEIKEEQQKSIEQIQHVRGRWDFMVGSGVVAGAISFFSLTRLEGAISLMVPFAATTFFIFNKNLAFTNVQKLIAIIIAVIIAVFGPFVLEWWISLYT